MSQWSHAHPEEMAEIAALPPSQQNAELRHAIGHDPDAIREQARERLPSGPLLGWRVRCDACGHTFVPNEGRPMCPDCQQTNEGATWIPEPRD